jgi:hypothetical protein
MPYLPSHLPSTQHASTTSTRKKQNKPNTLHLLPKITPPPPPPPDSTPSPPDFTSPHVGDCMRSPFSAKSSVASVCHLFFNFSEHLSPFFALAECIFAQTGEKVCKGKKVLYIYCNYVVSKSDSFPCTALYNIVTFIQILNVHSKKALLLNDESTRFDICIGICTYVTIYVN